MKIPSSQWELEKQSQNVSLPLVLIFPLFNVAVTTM